MTPLDLMKQVEAEARYLPPQNIGGAVSELARAVRAAIEQGPAVDLDPAPTEAPAQGA